MNREELAAQLESLALHAATSGLGDAHDLLFYVAGAVQIGAEKTVIETLARATMRAMMIKELNERK